MSKREKMSQWLAPGKGCELPLTTPQLLSSLCQLVQCPHQPGWNSPQGTPCAVGVCTHHEWAQGAGVVVECVGAVPS